MAASDRGSATKPLGQAQLSVVGTPTTVYTAPTSPSNAVTEVDVMWICNSDTVARQVTLRYGTGALTSANGLLEQASIPANTTWVIESQQGILIMGAGTRIEGYSDAANKITVTVQGMEFTS